MDFCEQLEESLRGGVCLMGLGNVDYGDDGLGVRLAEELAAAGVPNVVIAGANPEQLIGRVADQGFAHIVFLDAVECGSDPGAVVFMRSSDMISRFPQISTHKISLSTLAMWAEVNGRTKAWLLGVQPESIKQGSQISPALHKTKAALRDVLLGVLTRQAPKAQEGAKRAIA